MTSTWNNITTGLHAAVYDSYTAKSSRQRAKREVMEVMADVDGFCQRKRHELEGDTYRIGDYRHFRLKDKKKERYISVLPYEDRCVQNDMKDAIEPLLLRQMTDDMMGGLPGRGVLASDKRHQVVARMRVLMNDRSLTHCLQGDISKFYDNVDNVVSMRLIERQVKDKRTRAIIRQHLFNQKKLAIGDPFSHLIANLNMSVIIRKAKELYGDSIKVVNFADDFIAFSKDKTILNALRKDMQQWARRCGYTTSQCTCAPLTVRTSFSAATSSGVVMFTSPKPPRSDTSNHATGSAVWAPVRESSEWQTRST